MKPFTVIDVAQRSPEWFAARCGKLTGSCAGDMVSTIKSGESAARRDLRVRLVIERLTGVSQDGDGFVSKDMQRGTELEPEALAAYEALTGELVDTTGFLQHAELQAGCSLDGHVGDFETIVSLKCPKSATHLAYLRAGVMPASYVPQMLHELWITGARFYDFLSFDPRFTGSVAALRTFYLRIPRDEAAVEAYAKQAKAFLAEIDREVEAVQTMTNLRETLEQAVSA